MSNNERGRKILWWHMPISADDSAEVGGGMFRAIIVWISAIVFLLVVLGVVLAIT